MAAACAQVAAAALCSPTRLPACPRAVLLSTTHRACGAGPCLSLLHAEDPDIAHMKCTETINLRQHNCASGSRGWASQVPPHAVRVAAPQLWGRAGLQAGAAWCVGSCPCGNSATLQGSTAAAGSRQGQPRADGDRGGMLAAFLVACRPHTRHGSHGAPCQVRACMR